MKKVYICSPCRGENYDTNIENAINYAGEAFRMGYLPIAPHIYFTRFLNDDIPAEREAALRAGSELLLECSEVWAFGLDNPSEGMTAEIALAIRNGIPVKDGPSEIMKRTREVRMRQDIPEDVLQQMLDEIQKEPLRSNPIREEAPACEANHGLILKVTLTRRPMQP